MCIECRKAERKANAMPARIPCPEGCGNTIRWNGPTSTPAMCLACRRRVGNSPPSLTGRPGNFEGVSAIPMPEGVDPLLVPQNHLWFPRARVFEFVYDEVGETVRTELSKHGTMMARWDTWRSRDWLRFDQVDDLLCVLGLWVGDLGEPFYSGSEKRYPVLVAA